MKVKNTYILSGVFMTTYNNLMPHQSYDMGPSILYECNDSKWFVTTSPTRNGHGLQEVSKDRLKSS